MAVENGKDSTVATTYLLKQMFDGAMPGVKAITYDISALKLDLAPEDYEEIYNMSIMTKQPYTVAESEYPHPTCYF